MKKIFILTIFIISIIFVNAQVKPEIAKVYFGQIYENAESYRDVIIENADNNSYPAVGNYRVEKSYYYSYSHHHGKSLQMITIDSWIAAIKFTEYYIYDDFQNLKYYVYQCEEFGGIIMKFDGEKSEIIESSDNEILAENYFLDVDEFNSQKVIEKSDIYIGDCEFVLGIPNYSSETLKIREIYKAVNEMNNLVERKSSDIIGYYNNNELVKIVMKDGSNREFYLNNGNLVFAYYPQTESDEAQRVYFSEKGEAFQIIFGKKYLSKTVDQFHDIKENVIMDFEDAINAL